MEITSRVDDSEIENLKILEKIIDLTSDQLVYKLSECLHDDLSEFEKSKTLSGHTFRDYLILFLGQ